MKQKIKIGITSGHKSGIGTEIIEEVMGSKNLCNMYSLSKVSVDDDPTGIAALESAKNMLNDKEIDAVVTMPISKEEASKAGFPYVGHTEFFSENYAVAGRKPLMIMVAGDMRIALVTKHVALKDVPQMLSVQLIVDCLRSLSRTMKVDFGIAGAKIAVLSLNPHSGEGGMLGNEEREIIIPAIEAANGEGINAFGAYAADGFFGSGAYTKFDAVLAMYHDQGLVPFKALSFDSGVNFTAGLPVVRTSPAHGVGLDIAGQGIASPSATLAAIYLAADIVRSRKQYSEFSANPLQKQRREDNDGRRGGKVKDANVDELLSEL